MSKVYFIDASKNNDDSYLCDKINDLIQREKIFSFISRNDFIGIKTHFGESSKTGYVRSIFLKSLGEIIKNLDAYPFLTETSTLYKGKRNNSISHIQTANEHGFGYENTGLPIIMADGLWGEDGIEVPINGKIFDRINVASIVSKCNGMIVVSHFTGHMMSGFGGAIKNIAMGCVSIKGKLVQHAKTGIGIDNSKCLKCKECIGMCPVNAIKMQQKDYYIDESLCIGCGQCLNICNVGAISFDWDSSNADFQRKLVEHALGVMTAKKDKIVFINFLTMVSKNCDCVKSYKEIVPDIGILISNDPLAIDKASVDLIEERSGKKFYDLTFRIPYSDQLEYSREIGLGDTYYELVK